MLVTVLNWVGKKLNETDKDPNVKPCHSLLLFDTLVK